MEYARMKSFMESHENANTSYMNKGIKMSWIIGADTGVTSHVNIWAGSLRDTAPYPKSASELAKNLYPQYLRQNDVEKVKMIKIVN